MDGREDAAQMVGGSGTARYKATQTRNFNRKDDREAEEGGPRGRGLWVSEGSASDTGSRHLDDSSSSGLSGGNA